MTTMARCLLVMQRSAAWVPLVQRQRSAFWLSTTALRVEVDDQGRTIRSRRVTSDGTSSTSSQADGGWNDFDPLSDKGQKRTSPPRTERSRNDWGDGGRGSSSSIAGRGSRNDSRSTNQGRNSRSDSRSVGERNNRNENRADDLWGQSQRTEKRWNDDSQREDWGRTRPVRSTDRTRQNQETRAPDDKRINMNALEGAGFVHLYGLASCLNALQADRRDFTRPEDLINIESLTGESREHEMMQRARKPEAQFSPYLLIQERGEARGDRAADKAIVAEELERLAKERGLPVATVDKGVLNALSGNRPHQGYVLRCGKLEFESLPRLPTDENSPKLWLVLDEVVDPQNLGALLRSAYFLGRNKIGVMVCAKNSAPPSPVVSAASAGALELLTVFSTSNLPRTLNAAKDEGFRVIGASSSVPNLDAEVYNLSELPPDNRRTVLVLGSEGSGLRTLVAKACTDFVKIPGMDENGVDSLNVSVTGGILLWHLMNN